MLSHAIDWAGESEATDGEVFNITNGDFFRWCNVWPRIAEVFHSGARVEVLSGLLEALTRAGQLAQAGDAVVLSPACASFDEFESFNQRCEVFADWVREHRGGQA